MKLLLIFENLHEMYHDRPMGTDGYPKTEACIYLKKLSQI
jgi:hypothetical protein